MATEIRRSLVFGLGEQGQAILKESRRRLEEHWEQEVAVVRMVTIAPEAVLEANVANATIPLQVDEAQVEACRKNAHVRTWLPELPEKEAYDLTTRAGARLVWLDHYQSLYNCLKQMVQEHLLSPAIVDRAMASGIRVAQASSIPIDIYLVGNVGEAAVGGILLDVAYLIRDYLKIYEADAYNFNLYGVLLLPAVLPITLRQTMEQKNRTDAMGYATLKELDYAMHGKNYRLIYPREQQEVKFKGEAVFDIGNCFLIGESNEGGETIVEQDAIHMTAEWLCHNFLATVNGTIVPSFKTLTYGRDGYSLGAYSSIGLSALVLPIPFIRRYCAHRLTIELVGDLLRDDPQAERAQGDSAKAPILRDDIGKVIEQGVMQRQLSITNEDIEGLNPIEAEKLEKLLIEKYDTRRGTTLSQMIETMQVNSNKEITSLETIIRQNLRGLFREDSRYAINRSLTYLQVSNVEIANRRTRWERQNAADQQREQSYYQKILQARGMYMNVAQVYGNNPILMLGLTVLALGILLLWLYYVVGVLFGESAWATALVILILILMVLGGIGMWSGVGTQRAAFVQKYNEWLVLKKQVKRTELMIQFAQRAESYVHDIGESLEAFQARMRRLYKEAQTKLNEGQEVGWTWEERLYGYPYFRLEESIATPDAIATYYKSVRGLTDTDYERHFNLLFTSKDEYYEWAARSDQDNLFVEQFWKKINDYSYEQSAILQERTVVDTLEARYPDAEAIRRRLSQARRHARPYLSTRLNDLGERSHEAELQEILLVDYKPGEDNPFTGSKVAQALGQLSMGTPISIGNPYQLIFISVRHFLPNFILPNIRTLQPAYEPLDEIVHTTRGNLALPDLVEGYDTSYINKNLLFDLTPRPSFVLALALAEHPTHPIVAIYYHGTSQTTATPANGYETLPQEQNRWQYGNGYYLEYVSDNEARRAAYFERESVKETVFLGRSKAAACRAILGQGELHYELYKALATYLQNVTPKDIFRYLDERVRDPNVTMLEDWERLELEMMIDNNIKGAQRA